MALKGERMRKGRLPDCSARVELRVLFPRTEGDMMSRSEVGWSGNSGKAEGMVEKVREWQPRR